MVKSLHDTAVCFSLRDIELLRTKRSARIIRRAPRHLAQIKFVCNPMYLLPNMRGTFWRSSVVATKVPAKTDPQERVSVYAALATDIEFLNHSLLAVSLLEDRGRVYAARRQAGMLDGREAGVRVCRGFGGWIGFRIWGDRSLMLSGLRGARGSRYARHGLAVRLTASLTSSLCSSLNASSAPLSSASRRSLSARSMRSRSNLCASRCCCVTAPSPPAPLPNPPPKPEYAPEGCCCCV
ncbi:hypothetical protein KC361_g234 [Hortaea werneckii]|nr:hypothetical protein KC361_g234 [Hortaea werneckii]